MAKFAKVIDVEGVKGVDQVLIYVHKHPETDLYICSIFTHLPFGEADIQLNINPKSDDDNCFDSAINIFNEIAGKSDQEIINNIINSDLYKYLIGVEENQL